MTQMATCRIGKEPRDEALDGTRREGVRPPEARGKKARTFEIIRRAEKTAVLMVSPECSRLPEDMGTLAPYISGKAGGLGEVVTSLCEGLRDRGVECHLTTLNLKKRFQAENHLDEQAWRAIRHGIDPEKIHLVSSSVYAAHACAYSGEPALNAAEFQKQVVNNVMKTVRAKNGGRLLLHSHDWMAGGVITAYAKSRGCPVLHTVHNVHTGHVPLDMLVGVDIDSFGWSLHFSDHYGRRCVDAQASAIKSATHVNFVGEAFLREVVQDHFADQTFIPASVRREIKAKYACGAASSILNAMSLQLYPERCASLVRRFGPKDDILAAKRENRVAFQKRMGLKVSPDAILLYWPSRLDPFQKGVGLLEDVAQRFVNAHDDVQIAVVGNALEQDRTHEEILGRIACASSGRIAYARFNEDLSLLGYAAASDVFGASLYEPCGQIDSTGNLFGATATNRDTGGYTDKIRELHLRGEGYFKDEGNGFLFRDYDAGGLEYGLSRAVAFHRMPEAVRERQLRRIMKEARERYALDKMVDAYLALYEKLNGGKPLA